MASERWQVSPEIVIKEARDQSLWLIHDLAVLAGHASIAREALSEMLFRATSRRDLATLELALGPINTPVAQIDEELFR